jgi:hypothetical protein
MKLLGNGQLTAGVELLCLIGCGLDACRYLQAAGEWDAAARFELFVIGVAHGCSLAKTSLPVSDLLAVLSSWAEHLCKPGVGRKVYFCSSVVY